MGTKPFDIGLVGAGAVSAGAYMGWVLDLLIQALDAWYAAKTAVAAVPPHQVCLKVFSGASAGAVTAALAAGCLGSDQPPIATPADAARLKGRNKLYDAWVDRTDIQDLLGDRDLKAAGAVPGPALACLQPRATGGAHPGHRTVPGPGAGPAGGPVLCQEQCPGPAGGTVGRPVQEGRPDPEGDRDGQGGPQALRVDAAGCLKSGY
jgi:hypothetical protein